MCSRRTARPTEGQPGGAVDCCHFTEALPTRSRQILDGTRAFVTLFAFDRIVPGFPTNPITDDSDREYLDDIGRVIRDNTPTASLIEDILALPNDQVLVHRQPALDEVAAMDTTTTAYSDETFTEALTR